MSFYIYMCTPIHFNLQFRIFLKQNIYETLIKNYQDQPTRLCTEAPKTILITSAFRFADRYRHVRLPRTENPSDEPPLYIVRALLLYGRSHCKPTFTNTQVSPQLGLVHSPTESRQNTHFSPHSASGTFQSNFCTAHISV